MFEKTIFDLGFHNGDDTDYYLKKDYKVIAVDANPELIYKGTDRFASEIKSGQLILLNKIFYDINDIDYLFYINKEHSDWSTCDPVKVSFWKSSDTVIKQSVKTINLKYLFQEYGIPYFIKTDIEGLDFLVIRQLFAWLIDPSFVGQGPLFLSFELSRFDYYKIFSFLYACDYTKFKLINQANNEDKTDKSINYKFGKYHSGLFGDDLFRDEKYLSFDECLTQYMKYKELKEIDNQNLALGWLDIHAAK